MDRPVEILVVEDNVADVRLLQEGLKECQLPHRLHVVSDGGKALALLSHLAESPPAARPDVMVLDLNLPCYDGWEVLAALRKLPALHALPVIVLTERPSPRDEERRAALRPHLCFQKPGTLEAYFHMAQAIGAFGAACAHLHFPPTLSVAA
jgi:CheY-like chemotaxis protein